MKISRLSKLPVPRPLLLAALAALLAPAAHAQDQIFTSIKFGNDFISENNFSGVAVQGDVVYAVPVAGALRKSIDGGATFSEISLASVYGSDGAYNNVSFDGSLVAVARGSGLAVSTNAAASFVLRTTAHGLGSNDVRDVLVIGNTIYAATAGGLSISTDSGASFNNRTTADGLGTNSINRLFAVGNSIYAATDSGVSISTNGGNTFTNRTTADGLVSNLATCVHADGNNVFVGGDRVLSISRDGGVTFTQTFTGDRIPARVNAVYASGNKIYLALNYRIAQDPISGAFFEAYAGSLTVSYDGGETFVNYTSVNGLSDSSLNDISVEGNLVWAATLNGLSYGIVSPNSITATPSSLSGFSTTYGTASAAQSFTANGSSLDGDLVITAPTGYELSTNNSSFSPSLSLAPTALTVPATSIYTRIMATPPVGGSLSGNITLTSPNAFSRFVSLSGTSTSNLSVSTSSLSGFQSVYQTPSASQSFTVSGTTIQSGITLNASTGYELSTNNSSFSPSLFLPATDLTVTPTTIYARISATPPIQQSLPGTITIATPNAATPNAPPQTVSLSGSALGLFTPTVSSLINFSASGLNASASQSFMINATGATKPISFSAPQWFQVSLDNSTFSSTATLYGSDTIQSVYRGNFTIPSGKIWNSGSGSEFPNQTAFAAISPSGSVIAWGNATNGGSLGGAAGNLTSGVQTLYSSSQAFAAVKANGSVVAWGNATNGGSLGGAAGNLTSGVVSIASTTGAFAALKQDGSVVSWGDSAVGSDPDSASPLLTSNVTSLFSTQTAFAARKSNGSIVTWGNASNGGNSSTPTGGNLTSGVVSVTSNARAFAALKSNGSVVTWGERDNGGAMEYIVQSEQHPFDPQWNYISVAGNLTSNVTAIYSTNAAFAAIKTGGEVVTWGWHFTGGDWYNYQTVHGGNNTSGVVKIFTSDDAFAGLKADGSVVTWGGLMGIWDSWNKMGSLTSGVVSISTTRHAFAALKNDGSVVAWGTAEYGGDPGAQAAALASGVVSIASTGSAFAALKEDGTVVAWGNTAEGGDASAAASQLTNIAAIKSTSTAFVAVKEDGTTVPWGAPGSGGSSAPAQVGLNPPVVPASVYVRIAPSSAGGPISGNLAITSPGMGDKSVFLSGTVLAPAMTPSTSSLSGFTASVGNASPAQSLTVNGTLLSSDITVSAPTGFQVSTNNSSFSSSVTLPQSGGNVSNATIYIRIPSSAPAGSYTGNLTLTSTDAVPRNIALSGQMQGIFTPSVSSLGGFNTITGNSSSSQTFDLSATGLSSTVEIVAPTGFEVSTDNENFSSSVTVSGPGKVQSVYNDDFPTASGKIWGAGSGREFPNAEAFAGLSTNGSVVTWGAADAGGDSSSATISSNVTGIYSSGGAFAALKKDGSVEAWGNPSQGGSLGPDRAPLVLTGTTINTELAASSSFNANFRIANAFDNDPETSWAIRSNLNPQGAQQAWFSFTLDQSYTTAAIRYAPRGASGQADGVDTIRVWISETPFTVTVNNAASTTQFLEANPTPTFTHTGFRDTDPRFFNFPAPVTGRYVVVQLLNTTGPTGQNIGAKEFGLVLPTPPGPVTDAVDISSTSGAFAALIADGSVFSWGDGGQGGDSTNATGGNLTSGVVQVYSNQQAFAALKSNGSVVTWGETWAGGDSSGALGGNLTSGVVDVYSNAYAFAALKSNGSVVAWGENLQNFNSPYGGNLTSGVVEIFSTESAFAALKDNGSVVVWGDPANGGDPGASSIDSGVVTLAANLGAFIALKEDGTIEGWGRNEYVDTSAVTGQLNNIVAVYSNRQNFAAVKSDGSVVSWPTVPSFPINLGATGGTPDLPVTVYVRLSPTAPGGNLSGNLSISGADMVTASVAVSGYVIVPRILVTPSSLGGFTSNFSSPSASQSFSVNGTELQGNVTVTAPTRWEVSQNNSSFSTSLTLTPSGENLSDTTLYARISASAPSRSLSANLTLTSIGVTRTVGLSGTVLPLISPSTLGNFTAIYGVNYPVQSFSLNGSGLVGMLTLSAPTGFQVSTDNSTFFSSLALPYPDGTIQTVYTGAFANYTTGSGKIWVGGTGTQIPNGAAFAAITSEGKVVAWGDPARGGDASGLIGNGNIARLYSNNWAFTAVRYDGSATAWGHPDIGGNSTAVASSLSSNVTSVSSTNTAFAALKTDGSVVTWGNPVDGGDSSVLVGGNLSSNVTAVYSNSASFAALKDDGSVVTWGPGPTGGNSTIAIAGNNYFIYTSYVSVAENLTSNVTAVYSSERAFAALKSNGSVVTWGDEFFGGGQTAIEIPSGQRTSMAGALSENVVKIVANQQAFAALKSDGSVVTWGYTFFGGSGSLTLSSLQSGVVEIYSAQSAFAALKEDGSVVAWGTPFAGGNATAVAGSLQSGVVTVVSTSTAFAALKENGEVVCWGDPGGGGSGYIPANVVAVYATASAFAALKDDGSVVTWGNSNGGGDSSYVSGNLSSGVVEIFSTGSAFAALKEDGSVVAWGDPSNGGSNAPANLGSSSLPVTIYTRLNPEAPVGAYSGNLTLSGAETPTQSIAVSGTVIAPTITPSTTSLPAFTTNSGAASASKSFTINGTNLDADITVTAPVNFEVSTNNSSFSSSLVLARSGGTVTTTPIYARVTSSAASGFLSGNILLTSENATTKSVAVTATVYAVLSPSVTTLGNFTTPTITTSQAKSFTLNGIGLTGPVIITAPAGFEVSTNNASFSSSVSVKPTSVGTIQTVYTGAFGNYTTAAGNILRVGSGTQFPNSNAFAAIQADGSVVAWGEALSGGDASSPTGGNLTSNVAAVFSNSAAFAALKEDGSVVTWGAPSSGGNSSISYPTYFPDPFFSVASSLTSGVVSISSTRGAFAALKEDGSVVSWGESEFGGNQASVDDRLTSNVTAVYSNGDAFAALKNDGSVVAWGFFRSGGDTGSAASSLTSNVIKIVPSAEAFAALKSDGSVVTWGSSDAGGDSSSVASALSSNVTAIYSTSFAFAALKSNGSVVTWGGFGGNDSSSVAGQLASGVVEIYSTESAFAALKQDGSVVAWGAGGGDASAVAGQLTSGVVEVLANIGAFAALKEDGSVVTWGVSSSGGDSSSPTGGNLTSGVNAVYSTANAFAALKEDGSVVTWGNAAWGGNSTVAVELGGFPPSYSYTTSVADQLTSGVVAVYSSSDDFFGGAFAALKSDGSVVTWGLASKGGTGGPANIGAFTNNIPANIFVRIASGQSVGPISGNLTLSSAGAVGQSISLSGNVLPPNLYWTGATNNIWNGSNNWSFNQSGTPTTDFVAGTGAVFSANSTTNYQPIDLGGDLSLLSLEVVSNNQITLAGGNLTLQAISGNAVIVNNGELTVDARVILAGSATTVIANAPVSFDSIAGSSGLILQGNSTLTIDQRVWVGELGGSLAVQSGTFRTLDDLSSGVGSSNETITANGSTSAISVTETLNIGYDGTNNSLTLSGGASATAQSTWIGGLATSAFNSANITGAGTALNATSSTAVGYAGSNNTLILSDGASAYNIDSDAYIGFESTANSNSATVTGANSTWTVTGQFLVGYNGTGNTLLVANGGRVLTGNADANVGFNAGANTNSLTINGTGSRFTNNGTLYIGNAGAGNTLSVLGGGNLTTRNGRIGTQAASSNNTALVSGAGSVWNNTGTLRLGNSGSNNALTIANGGTVGILGNSFLGHGATSVSNLLSVNGTGSLLQAGNLTVGHDGSLNTLSIVNGGNATFSGSLGIGFNAASANNTVSVSGTGSVLSAQNIQVGTGANNKLVVAASGTVSTGNIALAGPNAILQIGNGASAGSLTLTGSILTTGTASGRGVVFNHTDASYLFPLVMEGDLGVNLTGAGTTVLTGANTYTGTTTVTSGTLQIGNGGTIGSIAGDIVNNASLVINRSDSISLSNVVGGNGSITKLGTNTLTITSNNTYTGATTISSGTLQIGDGSTTGSLAGNIVNNASLVFNRSDDVTYSEVISSNGSITKLGAGTLALTATNTCTGTTTISAGTLQLGNGGTTGSLAGSIVANADLAINRSDDFSFTNTVTGTGALVKLGNNTLTYASNNVQVGTVIGGGTLRVTGTAAAVTVASGGLLAGNGTTGDLLVQSGGAIAPGNSPGTLSTGNVTLDGGAIYNWEFTSVNGTAGTHWDLVDSTGTLTVNATSADPIVVNVSTTASLVDVKKTSWVVGNFPGGIVNFDRNAFTVVPDNIDGAEGTFYLAVGEDTTSLVLVYVTAEVFTSVTSLSDFTTMHTEPSPAQSFSVNGSQLQGDIIVTAPADFEVSTDNATFSGNVTIAETEGTVTDTPVFVRITAEANAGPASGNITVSSQDADDKFVELTGLVTPLPLTVTINAQPIQSRAGQPIISTQPPNTTFPRVTVTSNGTAIAGATVNVTVNQNSGNFTGNVSLTTNATGVAVFNNISLNRAGAGYTLTFSGSKLNYATVNTTSSQFPIIAAAPANASFTTQPGNTTYGSGITGTPVVLLTDAFGNPVANTNISALLPGGNFTASSNTTVRTSTNGTASFPNLFPAAAGNFTLVFDTAAAGVPDLTSNVTVSPLATTLTIGNATMQAAASLPTDLAVSPAPSFSTTAFSQNASAILGNFTYTTTNTTAVGNYSLGIVPGAGGSFANYNITTVNGTLTVTAGNASQLAEVSTPVTTEAGRPLEGVNLDSFAPEAPTIFVGDEFGNPVSGITVNATLSTNPGNATLNGTTSVTTDATGNATFSDIVITAAADGYMITYSADGLSDLVTEEFNIEPAAADQIIVESEPADSIAGQIIGSNGSQTHPAVQVLDAFGNPVNRAYNIEATLASGNFTANTTNMVLTDATGYGVFANLVITKSGVYQIDFAPLAAGNITVATANFTVSPDTATANISVATQPGNSTAGETLAGPPTAQILDQYDNPIGNYTVSAALNTGNFSTNSTTSNTTDTTGNATLDALRIETAGNYTLTLSFSETTSANSSVTTSNFTVNPAAPAKLMMVTEPSATAQAGIATASQPAVRLQDAFSNNVLESGTVVSATVNDVNGGVSVNATAGGNTTASTDGNGTATFSGLSINGTVGNYTLTFSSGNLTTANATTTIALSAGNPSQLSVSTQPSSTAMANATFGGPLNTTGAQPIVQILDAWSNHVSTDNSTIVSASLNTGGLSGNLSGTSNATASSGNASFTNLRITGQAGNYTLTFNATGLTAATSNTTEITPDLTTANITMGTQPGNSTAGLAIVGAPSISILDQYSNPVGNYSVSARLNGATLTSNSTRNATTGTDGNATFSNLITNTSGTGYTLSFSFNATIPTTASNSTTSANFTVSPNAAFGLVMVSQPPTTAQAGVPFDDENAPQVRVKDRFNNNVPVANMTISATANGGTGNASGVTNALTDESGTATFYGLGINGTVGVYTLTFSNGTLTTNATSNNVTLTPGIPTKVVVAQQPPATAQANATLSPAPAVSLQDTWNNNVTTPGITVNATLQGGGASLSGTGSTTTNATGAANFTDLRIEGATGNYELLFTSGNFASTNSTNIALTADQSTATIAITSNATTSTAGQTIQGSPAATIEDQYGNALSGYSVTAALNGATLASGATSANTDGNGTATFSDLVTNTAGDFTLTLSFNENGASGNATTPTFTVNPAAAAALAITTQPSSTAQAGIALAQQPVIQVKDQFGNNAPDSGLVIAATSNGSATANGTTTATTSNGTAAFSGLLLEGTAGNYTLTFGNGSLSSVTSDSIALGAGTAVKLAVTTQPGNSTAAGDAFSPQPAVTLQDAWNNAVSQGNVTVTAAVTTGNASVSGNTTATSAGDGVALFDGLTIAGQVGNYTLTFNASALTDATSDTVAVTANPATAVISISANATTSIAGQAFAGPPAATIVDGSGNPLNGISVSAAINQNSGNFSGTTSVSTNSTGVASFGNLTQTVAASGYNLTLAFNNGQTSGNATTANFSVTAAAAANMTVSRQPINTIAGLVIAANPQGTVFPAARLRDAFGNPVVSQNVTVTLQTGNLTGNLTVLTDGTGNATFSNLVCTTAGFYRMAFASANVSLTTSNGFNIFANAGTTLALVNTLQTTAQAGVVLDPQPVIQIRDNFGNNASLENVSITVNASTDGISGGSTTVLTNGNGTATYSGLLLTGLVGNRTLTFNATTGNLTSAVSPAIDLTAGPAASLIVSLEPATAFIAGNELLGAGYVGFPTVTVQDAYNNPVSVTVNATGVGFTNFGNGSVTSLPTDGNGTAVFPNLMVVEAGQNQRVNFASGNVSANTNTFNVFPGDPVSMAVTAQPPTSIAAGATLSPNPAVTLYDAFSNTVTTNYDVEVSLIGNGTLTGNTTAVTFNGMATFTSLSIAQLGDYTLSFRTLGYDPEITATSNQFSVISPTASGLAITGISAVDATTYQIAFTAAQGGDYWIERTTNLTSGVWDYVSTTPETAVDGANTVNVTSPGGTKAFWRLTTQQPPL